MLVFNSTPPNQNPPPSSCKDRPNSTAAQAFPASVTPHGDLRIVIEKSNDYGRTSRHDKDYRDVAHSTINLAQGAPMAQAREKTIMVTIIGETRKLNTSPVPTYQQEQKTKTGMKTLVEQQPPYSKHTSLTRLTKPTKKVLPHQMTTLPHMITTQTLLNLSLAVIQVENSSPTETPPMLNYKAALSLRKKKILCCKAELRPTCQLTLLWLMDIRNYQPLLLPRKVNRATEPTWIGWPWKKRNSTKNNRENERSGSKCPPNSKC